MRSWIGIGVMVGSSLDGVDLALCRYSQSENGTWNFDLLASQMVPLGREWGGRLKSLPESCSADLVRAHVDFGHHLGQVLRSFCSESKVSPDFVAVHGPTIFHQPEHGFTFQLGAGEVIVTYGDWPVVSDFRSKDIVLGGQGAPLVTEGERLLFPDIEMFLNLGGIVNLGLPTAAFDVCVGNQVLNDLATEIDSSVDFDSGGRMARGGTLDANLLASLESHPWYMRPPPKSLGREWYERELAPLLPRADSSPTATLRTLVEHIALRVAAAVAEHHEGAGRMLITGGGAENVFLVERLRAKLHALEVSIQEPDSPEVPLYKEAIIFGFLGLLNLLGIENIRGSLTGACRSSIGGSVHVPASPGAFSLAKFNLAGRIER